MKKYILIAGLLASTQVQAVNFNLNALADEWLSKKTKTVENVQSQNQEDKQIQAKSEENVPAQNKNEVNEEEVETQNSPTVNITSAELKEWQEVAKIYYESEIIGWKSIGIDTPEKAKEWEKNDISASRAQHFIKFGIKTPKDAAIWIRASNPDKSIIEEIEKWHAINVTTTEQLSKWMTALGYSSNFYYYRNDIEKINNLYKNQKNTINLFLADKQELTKSGCQMDYSSYLQANISVSEAKVWCKLNIPANNIARLKEISIKPEELTKIEAIKRAENWMSTENIVIDILKWKKSGYEVSEFNQWYELGSSVIGSIDNVIKWKQKNIPSDVIKGWFSVGVNDFNSLPTFAKMGIKSPEEAQQWKAVGVQITYPSIFQEWLDMGFDTPAKIKAWATVVPELLSENINVHSKAQNTVKAILNAGYKTPEAYKMVQQKDQKENEKIKQERAKVKKICDSWQEKATEKTYSLKAGARVWSKVSRNTYTIQTVYQDSFLVWSGGTTWEIKKHLFIPQSELANAPSEYCYK